MLKWYKQGVEIINSNIHVIKIRIAFAPKSVKSKNALHFMMFVYTSTQHENFTNFTTLSLKTNTSFRVVTITPNIHIFR